MVYDKIIEFCKEYLEITEEVMQHSVYKICRDAIKVLIEGNVFTPREFTKEFCHFSGIYIAPNKVKELDLDDYILISNNYKSEPRNYRISEV